MVTRSDAGAATAGTFGVRVRALRPLPVGRSDRTLALTHQEPTVSAADPPPVPARVSPARWVAVLAILGLAVAAVLVAGVPHDGTGGAHGAEDPMLAVSPGGTIDLAVLSADVQELYHAVAADEDAMQAVRCYCGCERLLAHEDLRECFVRPDGTWERHAVGCIVCQDEARHVLAARAVGTPLDQIVMEIDALYGQITAPQESDA